MRTVFLKDTSGSELPELMTDHIFRNENWDERTAIVDIEGMADEVGSHRGTARPGLDRFLDIAFVELVDLLEELPLDERAFF